VSLLLLSLSVSPVSCRVRVAAMSSPVAASAPQDVSDITREFPQLNIDQSSSTTPNEIQNESQPPVVQPVDPIPGDQSTTGENPNPPANQIQPPILVSQSDQPTKIDDNNNNNTEKNKIWCRLLIPSKVAGAIIGKGGATIKSLRDEFAAIINIPEARAPERVLKICVTSREKLDLLIKKIADILKDEIMKSGIRRKEGETELRILVQSSQAGAIIGTKGTTVKTLRESTGSRININPECCPNSTERVAAIMGRPETVVKCISMIYDILDKVPPKGSEQRYDPNCFDQTYDYGGFGYDPRAVPPHMPPGYPPRFNPHHHYFHQEQGQGVFYHPRQPSFQYHGQQGNQNQQQYGQNNHGRFQSPNNAPEFIPNAQHGAPRGPGNQMMRGFNPNRGGFNNRSGPRGQGPR